MDFADHGRPEITCWGGAIRTAAMNPEHRLKIEQLSEAVLQQDASHRESFLAAACQDDDELRRQVADLLTQSGVTIETPGLEPSALEPGAKLGPYHIVGA